MLSRRILYLPSLTIGLGFRETSRIVENMPSSYLTREGYEKSEQELEFLRSIKRKEVAQRLQDAMEDGELIENAEYEDAKKATRDADKAGDNFKSTTNFGKNERGARSAARKMKKAETANKRLARSKRNIENLEKKIRKTEEKIRKLNPQIELTEVPD